MEDEESDEEDNSTARNGRGNFQELLEEITSNFLFQRCRTSYK